MAHTKRRKAYNLYRKEAKEARKGTAQALRRANRRAAQEALAYKGEVDVSLPVYQRTSGWYTW